MKALDHHHINLLKEFLDQKVEKYNRTTFIKDDPISIPHRFTKRQDIEISAFWTAILAWGQRKTIINKASELFELMDNTPHDFIKNHEEKDRKRFQFFKHRTFNPADVLYFLEFLQFHYKNHDSLEDAFLPEGSFKSMQSSLGHFHRYFFSLDHALQRTRKHIATPERNSACKRLNMYLRWMVRKDDKGVDFGLWRRIPASALMIPLDVHVDRVARKLSLLERKQSDWKAVIELTEMLKLLNPDDPVCYDFALFGLGVFEKDDPFDPYHV